jgi:hypothetical protein
MDRSRLPLLLLALALLALSPAAAQEMSAAGDGDMTYEAMRRYRLQLDWHPIGGVVPKDKFRFTNFIRMHPSGFPADKYNLYLAPTYGLGQGWEITAGVTGAERLGPGGNALFGGAGVQKQLIRETESRPAVSIGAYGMTGHDHHSGVLYLAGTKQIWSRGSRAVFLHGGAKLETYDSDDYGSSTGVRPYAGTTVALSRRFMLSGEFSPSQPWEGANRYAARATYLIYKKVGMSGGIRNNGYRTEPFIGITF